MGHERTVTNASQVVGGTVNYDAFGQVVGTTGSSGSSYMYGATSGYRNDWDGGLYHVGARYYDPQVGRFVTPDSFLSENPFLYCEHDPVNHLDPSGHFPNPWALARAVFVWEPVMVSGPLNTTWLVTVIKHPTLLGAGLYVYGVYKGMQWGNDLGNKFVKTPVGQSVTSWLGDKIHRYAHWLETWP